jgi:hypothetical protein
VFDRFRREPDAASAMSEIAYPNVGYWSDPRSREHTATEHALSSGLSTRLGKNVLFVTNRAVCRLYRGLN